MSTSPYLYRRNSGTYYSRFVLPKALCQRFNLTTREIRLSLRTEQLNEAKHRCLVLRYQLFQLLDALQRDSLPSQVGHIRDYLASILRQIIERFDKDKWMTDELLEPKAPLPSSPTVATDANCPDNGATITIFTEQRRPRNEITVEDADGVIFRVNHPNNPELEFEQATEYRRSFGSNGGSGGSKPTPEYKVSFVFNEYITKELPASSKANPNSIAGYIQMLNSVMEVVGPDRNYYTLTYDDVEEVRNKLLELPDSRSRAGSAKTISPQRAKKHLEQFKKVAEYAELKGFHVKVITNHVEIVCSKTQKPKVIYTAKDLRQLLSGYPYTQTYLERSRNLFDYHFWLLPMLLFTGARLNEVCQLQLSEFEKERGVWFFHIRPETDESSKTPRSVKNAKSIRKVPIHKTLEDLGLIKYVQSRMKVEGPKSMLFKGLTYDLKNHFAKKPSGWFNGNGSNLKAYKKLFEIEQLKAKTLHTFRDTFIHGMRNTKKMDRTLIPYIVGHESKGQTSEYGLEEVDIDILKEAIDMVDFRIDLNHLSYKAFVPYRDAKGQLK